MAKKATKLEDIGDERDQKVFMTTVKVWFNGDFQAALDRYNRTQEKYEALERQPGVVTSPFSNTAELRMKVPHS
ncbi:MAG: hypothetical protein WCK35_15935 [Chloroflexota bacterium]